MLGDPHSDQEERLKAEQTISGLDHGLNIVWELCETGEMAVSLVNSNNLLPIIFECLRQEVPLSLAILAGKMSWFDFFKLMKMQIKNSTLSFIYLSFAAQSLLTVSEDNPSAGLFAQNHPEFISRLSAALSSSSHVLRVNVAGESLCICVPGSSVLLLS